MPRTAKKKGEHIPSFVFVRESVEACRQRKVEGDLSTGVKFLDTCNFSTHVFTVVNGRYKNIGIEISPTGLRRHYDFLNDLMNQPNTYIDRGIWKEFRSPGFRRHQTRQCHYDYGLGELEDAMFHSIYTPPYDFGAVEVAREFATQAKLDHWRSLKPYQRRKFKPLSTQDLDLLVHAFEHFLTRPDSVCLLTRDTTLRRTTNLAMSNFRRDYAAGKLDTRLGIMPDTGAFIRRKFDTQLDNGHCLYSPRQAKMVEIEYR